MALKKFFTADSGGLNFLWKLIIKELSNLSIQIMTWANGRFIQSVNGKIGAAITIIKDDIGLENVDNTADIDKHVAHANTAGDADTLDGKHASDFLLKTEQDGYEVVIAQALTDLETRKIDKEDGKGLSTNDYTDDDKNKLAGIEEGAQVNDPNTVIDSNYIHTDNNYTTAEKNKLAGIEAGALKNTVISVVGRTGAVTLDTNDINGLQEVLNGKLDNLPFTSTPTENNKVVTQNELNTAVTGASSYLGTIDTVNELSSNVKKGDFYRVSTAWDDSIHVGDIIIAEKDSPLALIDGINWSLLHNEINTDTTYIFANGTDGFDVTPSTGTKQTVNISVSKVNGHTVEANVPADAVFTDTHIPNVAGEGIELSGDNNEVISLNTDSKTVIANAKTDHTNLGGHTVKTDVPSNAVFTDYQTSKVGHYTPTEEPSSNITATASGATEEWSIDVVKAVTIKRDSKGHAIGISVTSGKIPANPNTDYLTTKEGHYTPTDLEITINPDSNVLRDASRDMAFVGAIKEDSKGHVVGIDTVAILALTDTEIQAIVDLATAEIAAEMA